MNILILTAYPPVLDMHGGGVRMYHNIRILARRHAVHVISFVEDDDEEDRVRTIAPLCESLRTVRRLPRLRPNGFALEPFLMRYFDVSEMEGAVDETCARSAIEVLQCEYLQMARFHRPGLFTVWTAHEVLSANAFNEFLAERRTFEKVKAFYRWMSLLHYETSRARRFDRVVTMTSEDAAYLRSYVPGADIRDIPIGVDTARFTPFEKDPTEPLRVLFLGNFRHPPNLEAVRFLRDHVMPAFPSVRFEIAGNGVPPGLLDGTPARALGYQADTRVLYRRPNTIVAAPLFSGTGQRVKLLEAFAMGVPVITTPVGASGFPIRNGVEAFVAETPEGYRSALGRLCESGQLRDEMGERARRMILGGFDWDLLADRFLEVVDPPAVSVAAQEGPA